MFFYIRITWHYHFQARQTASEILKVKTKQGIADHSIGNHKQESRALYQPKYSTNINAHFSCALIALLADLQQNFGSLELLVLLVQAKRIRPAANEAKKILPH